MVVGEAVRKFRERAQRSQREVAEALGLAASRVSEIERGERRLLFEEAVRFAAFVELNETDWLHLRELVALGMGFDVVGPTVDR